MQPISARVLDSIIETLEGSIQPQLENPGAIANLGMVCGLLKSVQVSENFMPAVLGDVAGALPGVSAAGSMAVQFGDAGIVEARQAFLNQASDAFAGDLRAAGSGLSTTASSTAGLLSGINERYLGELARRSEEGASELSAPSQLSADQIEAYLKARGAQDWALPVTSVQYMPGGFSKETILISLGEGAATRDIVIRKIADGQPAEGLEEEWNAIRFGWSLGLPTPEPLWFEGDASKLGNVFIVVGKAPGRNFGDVWGRSQDVPAEAALELAGALARLHTAEISSFKAPPAPPMVTKADVAAAIELLTKDNLEFSRDCEPLYCGLVEWLKARIPEPPQRVTLLHGDIGFHNILIEGKRISAILDWERCHFGDPAEELAYVRPSIEGIVSWEDFLSAYQAAGGQAPNPEALHFYQVWQDVWRASACLMLRRAFMQAPQPRLNHAFAGLVFGPRFIVSATKSAFGETA